jgi:predicted DNA-binding protein (MmcQ/YjbR family)
MLLPGCHVYNQNRAATSENALAPAFLTYTPASGEAAVLSDPVLILVSEGKLGQETGQAMVAGSRRDRVLTACGAKAGAVEDYPFGDEVAVFKVARRMFALVPLRAAPGSVSLKCDPGLAAGLRERYAAITPGYHLNKRHWNTVTLDGSVPDEELLELVDHSYDLVLAGLTRAQRNQLIT